MTRKNDFITWRMWSPFNLKLTGSVLISRKTSLEVQELQGHSPKCTNLFPDRGLREHLCVQLFNYECMLFQLLPWMLLLKAVLLQINRAMAMLSWTWIWTLASDFKATHEHPGSSHNDPPCEKGCMWGNEVTVVVYWERGWQKGFQCVQGEFCPLGLWSPFILEDLSWDHPSLPNVLYYSVQAIITEYHVWVA